MARQKQFTAAVNRFFTVVAAPNTDLARMAAGLVPNRALRCAFTRPKAVSKGCRLSPVRRVDRYTENYLCRSLPWLKASRLVAVSLAAAFAFFCAPADVRHPIYHLLTFTLSPLMHTARDPRFYPEPGACGGRCPRRFSLSSLDIIVAVPPEPVGFPYTPWRELLARYTGGTVHTVDVGASLARKRSFWRVCPASRAAPSVAW